MLKTLYDLPDVQTATDKLNKDEIMAIINAYVKDLADENLRVIVEPDCQTVMIRNIYSGESYILSLDYIFRCIYDKYHNANICRFITGEENGKLVAYVGYQNKPKKELTV